jgi:hypothetical protein
VSTFGGCVTDEQVELDVRGEWNGAFSLLGAASNGVLVDGELLAAFFEVHEGLSELNETSLGGITLAESLEVGKALLSNSKTSFHLGLVCFAEFTDISNSDTLDTSVQLLSVIIRWLECEESRGAKDQSLEQFYEVLLFRVVTGDDLFVWLVLSLVLLVSLPVDRGIDLLSVVEHVRNGHAVLSKSTGLVGADAGSGTKSLYGFEVLDEHHLASHSLGSDSKRYGNGSEETLWYVSDNDTDGEDHTVDEVESGQTNDEEDHTEHEGNERDDVDESLNFSRKRSLLDLSLRSKVSN